MRRAKWAVFGLKTGQRRDVTKRTYANVAMFVLNVATLQRMLLNNVATLDINVTTFQRLLIINVATLDSHVVTFQRCSKSTSRRSCSTTRRTRGTQNQRRDVTEKGKIEVATLRFHDVETSRR